MRHTRIREDEWQRPQGRRQGCRAPSARLRQVALSRSLVPHPDFRLHCQQAWYLTQDLCRKRHPRPPCTGYPLGCAAPQRKQTTVTPLALPRSRRNPNDLGRQAVSFSLASPKAAVYGLPAGCALLHHRKQSAESNECWARRSLSLPAFESNTRG
jgi:hypothetical protein